MKNTLNILKAAALFSLPVAALTTSPGTLPAHAMTASRVAMSSTSPQIVGVAATPGRRGMWTVTAAGTVTAYGTAQPYGSIAFGLTRPIVGMASTPDGKGYWLVASDGGIFTFGDATFYGSTGAMTLNKPIVGMASTPDGKGYWLVASDGGIFTFGDATFYGSTGNIRLNKPIVGMAASPTGNGYWMVASDGGIFTFGDATFHGAGQGAGVAIVPSVDGQGYVVTNNAGQTTALGDAVNPGAPVASAPTPTSTQHLLLPPNNPASSIPTPQSTVDLCAAAPTSSSCQSAVLAEIQNMRSSEEGLGSFTLPDNYDSLTPAQQAFVLINLERGSRGLAPIAGMSSELNAASRQDANGWMDPALNQSASVPGLSMYAPWQSIWDAGYNALFSDYQWMYADGYGSGVPGCTSPTASACWGHRDAILWSPGPLVMGAGSAFVSGYTSISAIFVQMSSANSVPTSDYTYTWADAVAHGASY